MARLVETVSDIGEHVNTVREYKDQAQAAATNALLAEEESKKAKEDVLLAQAGAESAADVAEQYALNAADDKAEVERLAAQVREDKEVVAQSKTFVENTVQGFEQTVQQAKESINTVAAEKVNAVQGAGTQAVQEVTTAKNEAVKAVEGKGSEQAQALEEKGREILESFPAAPDLATKLDKQQGVENAGKSLIIGEDGNVVPGEVQAGNAEVDATLTQAGKAADAKATGDKILQYAIKNTAQGTNIVLNDSAEEKLLDLKLQGWTEQYSTEGKNLFNLADVEYGTLTSFSSASGTSVSFIRNTAYSAVALIDVSADTAYSIKNFTRNIIWFCRIVEADDELNGYVNYRYYDSFNNSINYLQLTTGASTTKLILQFWTTDKTTELAEQIMRDVKIMICEGSIADMDMKYEPYTGNKPSPSPDYPQKIVSAGRRGKNLFDIRRNKQKGYVSGELGDTLKIRLNTDSNFATWKMDYNIFNGKEITIRVDSDVNIRMVVAFADEKNIILEKYSDSSSGIFAEHTMVVTESTKFIYLSIMDNYAYNNDNLKITVEQGNKYTGYEPYSDKYMIDVKLTGKNLWNPVSEDYVQGLYRGWYIDTEAKYITLSIRNKDKSVDVSGLYLGISGNGEGTNLGIGWVSLNVIGNSVNNLTLEHKYVTIYPPSDSNLQKLLDRFYIQVEEGRAVTEYEPYKEQLVTLVSDRLITKFDRLEKRDGVWGWAFKTGTLNLQDLDVFTIRDDGYTNNLTHRVYREIPDAVANSDAFCNKLYPFAAGDISGIKVADYECFNISNGDCLQMKLLKERGTTADELKAFFAESDIYVLYQSKNEEFVPLLKEEQELLSSLRTYYPTTVISNSEDCEMQVSYAADTKAYVDNLFLNAASKII